MGAYRYILATDGAGAATLSTAPVRFTGNLRAVIVDYAAGLAAGTDLTVTDDLGRTLVNRVNSATDFTSYLMVQSTDNAGTAISAQYWFQYLANTALNITVAQSTAATAAAVTITFVIDEG
jgi:hypothetical protein